MLYNDCSDQSAKIPVMRFQIKAPIQRFASNIDDYIFLLRLCLTAGHFHTLC